MRGGMVVAVDRQHRVDSNVDGGQGLDHVVRPLQRSRPDSSVAVSRALGTMVVTVHGALGAGSSGQLRSIARSHFPSSS